MYFVTSVELSIANLLSSGAERSPVGVATFGDERRVDRGLHVRRLGGVDLVLLLLDAVHRGDLGLRRASVTTCCTFHCGIRPLSVLSGDAVVIQSRREDHQEPMRPVNATRNPRRAPRLVPSSR